MLSTLRSAQSVELAQVFALLKLQNWDNINLDNTQLGDLMGRLFLFLRGIGNLSKQPISRNQRLAFGFVFNFGEGYEYIEMHMKNLLSKLQILLTVVMALSFEVVCAQDKIYCLDDIQGIWRMNFNIKYPNDSPTFGNAFYIYKNHNGLYFDISEPNCQESVIVYSFGFVYDESDVDSLGYIGDMYIEFDNELFYRNPIKLIPRQSLYICYDECTYLERLPKKAQMFLYKRSLYDHTNYAREFLDYDICGIKVDNVQMLDSLQNATGTILSKDDIVIVRDTTVDLLQVEFEPEPNKYIKGYLKRKDLQFVETKK